VSIKRNGYFFPEGVIIGFQNFACGFKPQQNLGDLPRLVDLLRFFFPEKKKKCLESPKKIDRKILAPTKFR
jgi:hypothetical protein